MATKQEFGAFLFKLSAAIPKFAPDFKMPGAIDAWFEELGQFDTATLTVIYKHCVARYESFPSIKQCLEIIGKAPPPPETFEDKGREVADRIWTAIGKFGAFVGEDARKKKELEEYVGPIGMIVIQMNGGWNNVCDSKLDDEGMLKAQWRGSAIVYAKKGGIGAPPQFDKPSLAESVLKRIEQEDPDMATMLRAADKRVEHAMAAEKMK